MNRHNKHYTNEEIDLLIKAKAEVDEIVNSDDVLKKHIGSIGGVWEYISKIYFDSKRKPKALAEQYRKEFAKLEEQEQNQENKKEDVAPKKEDNIRQLDLPFQDKDLLRAVNHTNRLLQKIVDLLSGDPNPSKGALILPLPTKQDNASSLINS